VCTARKQEATLTGGLPTLPKKKDFPTQKIILRLDESRRNKKMNFFFRDSRLPTVPPQ